MSVMKAQTLPQSGLQCLLSVSLLIFQEQFVLTGKCHATLSALTPSSPPHTATHRLSLSSHFSSEAQRVPSLPPLLSHLLMSFFSLYSSSHPPSAVRQRLSTASSVENNVQHFTHSEYAAERTHCFTQSPTCHRRRLERKWNEI